MQDAINTTQRVVAEAVRQKRAGELKPHWGDGILIYALARAGVELSDEDAAATASSWLDELIKRPLDLSQPSWEWGFIPVAAWEVTAARGGQKQRDFAEAVVTHMLEAAPRTTDGALATHGGRPQLWVDTMFFSIPALLRAANEMADTRFEAEAIKEFALHRKRLFDDQRGLYVHCWDQAMEAPVRYTGSGFEALSNPPFWARGNAWAFLTAVVLAEAGDEDAGTHVLGLVERILQYQDHASGLWRTVIDRPDCYLETSASAMFGYGLARAAAGSFVPFSHEAISGCWRGLTDYVTSEGRVLGVSAGTPPGAFAEYNSVPQGSETFGTGFVILLGLELAATLARKT